jgi:hypothetical protein
MLSFRFTRIIINCDGVDADFLAKSAWVMLPFTYLRKCLLSWGKLVRVKSLSPGHFFAQKRKTHVQNIPRIVSISTRRLFWRVDFQNVQDIAQNNAGVDFRATSGQIHSLISKDDDFIASGHHQTLILRNFIISCHKKVWVDVAVSGISSIRSGLSSRGRGCARTCTAR